MALRMERQASSAALLAQFLVQQPLVQQVSCPNGSVPLLPSFTCAGHDLCFKACSTRLKAAESGLAPPGSLPVYGDALCAHGTCSEVVASADGGRLNDARETHHTSKQRGLTAWIFKPRCLSFMHALVSTCSAGRPTSHVSALLRRLTRLCNPSHRHITHTWLLRHPPAACLDLA